MNIRIYRHDDSVECDWKGHEWAITPQTVAPGLVAWPHVICDGCGQEPRLFETQRV